MPRSLNLLSRRRLLQALGLGAGSLFLPSLGRDGRSDPSAGPLRRIAFVMTYHGTVYSRWHMRPGGANAGAFDEDLSALDEAQFSTILAPLHAYRDRMLVLDGVDLVTAKPMGAGIGHFVSPVNAMTGARTTATNRDARSTAASIDQIIAEAIARPDRIKSVEVGILDEPLSYATPGQALPRETRPEALWDRLFPSGSTPDAGTPTVAGRLQSNQSSVLDAVAAEYDRLAPRLSAEDREKLAQHRDLVRGLERRVSGYTSVDCAAPARPTPIGRSHPDRYNALTRDFTDLIALAFACDLTRVATVALTQLPNSAFGAPAGDVHQDFAHNADPPNPNPVALEQMTRYHRHHAGQIARLLEALDTIPEEDGSVLDNTLVVWLSEMADGTHHQDVYPMVLFGGRNIPLRWGRYLRFAEGGLPPLGSNSYNRNRPSGLPHNRILVSLAQAMGLSIDAVGDTEVATAGAAIRCTGAVDSLFV